MSHDLHLFRAKKGTKDLVSAWRKANEAALKGKPSSSTQQKRKRELARALVAEFPDLRVSPEGGLEEPARGKKAAAAPVPLELTFQQEATQITLQDDTAGVTVSGAASKRILRALEILTEKGPFHIYDPQAGRAFDLGRSSDRREVIQGLGLTPEVSGAARTVAWRASWGRYSRARNGGPFPETPDFRLRQLEGLLKANGIELSPEEATLQQINDWFTSCIEGHPVEKMRPSDAWCSVASDLALWLGDLIVKRSKGKIGWDVSSPKRRTLSVKGKGRTIEIDALVLGVGAAALHGGAAKVKHAFAEILEKALAKE